MSDFYERRISGAIGPVRTRLEAELKTRKYGVLHAHDVKTTLDSKGVPFATPMFILDVCNPGLAKRALDATDNRVAPLLPCSIALWQQGDETIVRMLRPSVLARLFPDSAALAEVAAEVEPQLIAAIEAAR